MAPKFVPIAALAVLLCTGRVGAEDLTVEGEAVTLAELLPALQGTEMGALVVAQAPRAGETGWVRASEVRAALKAAGRSDQGLAIPQKVRVVRVVRMLDKDELKTRVGEALAERVAPCTVDNVSPLGQVPSLPRDARIEVEADAPRDSGRVSFQVRAIAAGETVRMHGQVELTCPAPVVAPGAGVRIIVAMGNVRVSAPGVANQPGRVGDEVRVTNSLTKKSMVARVVDAQTVEVVP